MRLSHSCISIGGVRVERGGAWGGGGDSNLSPSPVLTPLALMTPALALAFDDWFRVCWLCCIRSSAKYFSQSSHTKSGPVVQADRQTACICIRGLAEHFWRKGRGLLFMWCCCVLRKHSLHLPTVLTLAWLKSGLARWGCGGWAWGCFCGCRSGESGPAATLSPMGSRSPSKHWRSIGPHQPALLQTAPGVAGSQLTLAAAVHR